MFAQHIYHGHSRRFREFVWNTMARAGLMSFPIHFAAIVGVDCSQSLRYGLDLAHISQHQQHAPFPSSCSLRSLIMALISSVSALTGLRQRTYTYPTPDVEHPQPFRPLSKVSTKYFCCSSTVTVVRTCLRWCTGAQGDL